MGMVFDGCWTDRNEIIENGKYVRPKSVIGGPIGSDIIDAMAAQPHRFWLIGSHSCPWSHRAIIVRQLKGLSDILSLHIAFGPRMEGYAANGGAGWQVPGTDREIVHLHELYTLSDGGYNGRSTVPILWDSVDQRIVSNESAVIMRALDKVDGRHRYRLAPDALVGEIDATNAETYALNNGVYRAGFAESQAAYEAAVEEVFAILDELEVRLSRQRYLLGEVMTEADWRLFPTLVRFDGIYFVLHKCCRHRLIDYPHLWAYARELYGWQGVGATVDFKMMRQASYTNDTTSNANGIVAVAPHADWLAPHGREGLGPALVTLANGRTAAIDPTKLVLQAEG